MNIFVLYIKLIIDLEFSFKRAYITCIHIYFCILVDICSYTHCEHTFILYKILKIILDNKAAHIDTKTLKACLTVSNRYYNVNNYFYDLAIQ